MTQIEIWLRLAQVNELYGDEMVRIATGSILNRRLATRYSCRQDSLPARQGAF